MAKAKTARAAKPKLPNTMSGLLRVALADLIAVERLKKTYAINMKVWHKPINEAPGDYFGPNIPDNKCVVCFAGSVMAMTLKVKPTEDIHLANNKTNGFDLGTIAKLEALDYLRQGIVREAAARLGIETNIRDKGPISGELMDVKVHRYEDDKVRFKKDMRKLADQLEAVGY